MGFMEPRNLYQSNTPCSLTTVRNANIKNDEKNYVSLSASSIKRLQNLGVKNINLDNIDPKIAFEMSDQLIRHLLNYQELGKGYLEYFGETQSLFEKNFQGQIENNVRLQIENYGCSERVAREFAEAAIPKPHISNFFTSYHKFEYYGDNNIRPINAICVNKVYSQSCEQLNNRLQENIKANFYSKHTHPAALITHEVGHALYYFLDEIGALDLKEGESLEKFFKANAQQIIDELGLYATYEFKEFIAVAFSESYHNPNPDTIAVMVRKWIDSAIGNLRRKDSMISAATQGPVPKFITTEWFVPEPGNWHLKPGAPQEVIEEFKRFIEDHKSVEPRKNEE